MGSVWTLPVLAHRAAKSGRVVTWQPHVLARRAHRIDHSGQGVDRVLAGRAQDIPVLTLACPHKSLWW